MLYTNSIEVEIKEQKVFVTQAQQDPGVWRRNELQLSILLDACDIS